MLKATVIMYLSCFLIGCVSDAEMEALYRQQCQFDRITFEQIKPGTAEFEHCLDLYRSGLGGYENDPHGGVGLGQFAD